MADVARRIADNLARIRDRIAEAAGHSGRSADQVTLVAITKYVGVREARILVDAGCRDLGESRPQELWSKAAAMQDSAARWHLIGHLQRNKVPRTLAQVALIHSGDSERLLAAIDRSSAELQRRTPVLLEINISGDHQKHGFHPGAIEQLLPHFAELRHVEIRGLMAMADRESERAKAKDDFQRLSELRAKLQENCPAEISLAELSIGMSDDFDIAIEQGATMVRVGSALFEGVD